MTDGQWIGLILILAMVALCLYAAGLRWYAYAGRAIDRAVADALDTDDTHLPGPERLLPETPSGTPVHDALRSQYTRRTVLENSRQ